MKKREKPIHKIDAKNHWDEFYKNKDEKTLGWYQEIAKPSLDIFNQIKANKDDKILIVGSGSTKLVDNLLEKGYNDITATDISKVALINLENRLTSYNHKNLEKRVKFIEDDLRSPKELPKLKKIDIWHDRAVLHFFTDISERESYFSLLKSIVKKDGYVIIAVYNKQTKEKCAGLDVVNYNAAELEKLLGQDFKLTKSFDYQFTQPSGKTTNYIYSVFKRIKKV